MKIIEDFNIFEERILELGFNSVGENTYRWYVSPSLYFDILFRNECLLFSWITAVHKPKELPGWMKYTQMIVRDRGMLWCEKWFIRRIMVSMFEKMMEDYMAKCWATED